MQCWRRLSRAELPAAYFYHAGLPAPDDAAFAPAFAALRTAAEETGPCACARAELPAVADMLGLLGDSSDIPRLTAIGACGGNPYAALRAAYALYNLDDRAAAEKILTRIAKDRAVQDDYRRMAKELRAAPENPAMPLPSDCGGPPQAD